MTRSDSGKYSWIMAGRRHYGIAEVADALGLNRQLVTVWRRRRSWEMPEPDDELASGPLWLAATIEPWIERMRARQDTSDAEPLSAALASRVGRRLCRLTALLLEDAPREQLIARAHSELASATDAVRACAPQRDQQRLLEALERLTAGDFPDAKACLTALGEALPVLSPLID
jgi:hypothetical protein